MTTFDRRKFLTNSLISAAGVFSFGPLLAQTSTESVKKQWTVQEVMDFVLKEGGLTPLKETVDTLKSGEGSQAVTGIVSTMFPTIPIIEEAIKLKANFIIAHEPSFYNHNDRSDWVKDNAVLKKKQDLLEKNKIAIWRFHDYCHRLKPDAVSYGVAKKANWLPYYKTGEVMLKIPSTSLKKLVDHLKTSLNISHVRVIGDLTQNCERIALLPGAWGGPMQVSTAEKEKPDVLIVGELSEWETAEYIRDARAFGQNISLIVLGHAVSEEPGMAWFAEWLQPKLTDIKITHISSGDPFTWL